MNAIAAMLVAGALASRSWAADRDFVIKVGVMERAAEGKDRLRETRTITMDPARRPGWCFLVDPPTDEPYEVYSITYLPSAPRRLSGDFKEEKSARAVGGLTTDGKVVDGIHPFCFDFDAGDPLGEYRVEVFVAGALKTTLRVQVVAPRPTR